MTTWLVVCGALVAASVAGWMTIVIADRLHVGKSDDGGVQGIHAQWTPRLGGVPLALASFIGLYLWSTESSYVDARLALVFALSSLPILLAGVWEDVSRDGAIWHRVLGALASAALAFWLLDARLTTIGIPLVDGWMQALPLGAVFLLTLFAVSGTVHSANLIDGCNGLSSGVCIIVLFSLASIAYQVSDAWIVDVSLILAAATLGFFVLNWPYGRIFLGDAGAYFLGFSIAVLSLMLVTRNPEVSPWAPLLLMIYPVWETLFTILRRMASLGIGHVGNPDTLHLHQIVYKRLVRRYGIRPQGRMAVMRNSMTSPYLWMLSLLCAVPAVLLWERTWVLMALAMVFVITYMVLYRRLVRFRIPRFLILAPPSRHKGSAELRPADEF